MRADVYAEAEAGELPYIERPTISKLLVARKLGKRSSEIDDEAADRRRLVLSPGISGEDQDDRKHQWRCQGGRPSHHRASLYQQLLAPSARRGSFASGKDGPAAPLTLVRVGD